MVAHGAPYSLHGTHHTAYAVRGIRESSAYCVWYPCCAYKLVKSYQSSSGVTHCVLREPLRLFEPLLSHNIWWFPNCWWIITHQMIMDISREPPDDTTKPTCYDSTNIVPTLILQQLMILVLHIRLIDHSHVHNANTSSTKTNFIHVAMPLTLVVPIRI